MSLGYGIGDFIAVGELCWKVYRQVYEVSRDAPAEVQSLQKDLSNLSNIIKSLVEDVQNPDSALGSAPSDRIKLTNEVMGKTKQLLSELEVLLKKYDILQPSTTGKKHFWRVALTKLQYVKEARTIAAFRAKIEYYIGLLTLLLLAGNRYVPNNLSPKPRGYRARRSRSCCSFVGSKKHPSFWLGVPPGNILFPTPKSPCLEL